MDSWREFELEAEGFVDPGMGYSRLQLSCDGIRKMPRHWQFRMRIVVVSGKENDE